MLEVARNTAEALVVNVGQLISLPRVYTCLEQALKDPEHTNDDLAKIINVDPALSARTLRIINSSYYALPNTVQSIAVAINLIGEYDLRNIVLVSSVINSTEALLDDGFDISTFWLHSIRCGIVARILAKLIVVPDPEQMFLAGLLHDLGQLIIYKGEPELSATVEWHIANEHQERYAIEETLLGFNHAVVGALLIDSWGLSAELNEIIKFHHQPEDSTYYQREVKLISLADHLVHYAELNEKQTEIDFEQLPALIERYLDDLKIEKHKIFNVLTDMLEQSQAIEDIICTN